MTIPVRIGMVADVQYADLEDREGARFRSSLGRLAGVLEQFAAVGVERVVQLGDVIEGHDDPTRSEFDLERVLAAFEASGLRVEHVVGNHCLRVPRATLHERLSLRSARRSFSLGGSWRVLVLDSMELSLCGGMPDEARAWLAAHPEAEHPHATPWNGGFGADQLDWLEVQLLAAARRGEAVLALSHHPVHPAAARPRFLAWDYPEVLARLANLPAPVAWFAGHDHESGHAAVDGVEHWTLPGMVATEREEGPGLVVELHPDRLEVQGLGGARSGTIG